jgi:hypothetical protein
MLLLFAFGGLAVLLIIFGIAESYTGYTGGDGPAGLLDGLGYYVAALVPLWIALAVVRASRRHVRWVSDMRARDFAWFKATHPASVTRDGVICTKCSSTKIHVRGVMNQSYMRAHVCTRCGETLYFSSET